jgi:hypothetical protein
MIGLYLKIAAGAAAMALGAAICYGGYARPAINAKDAQIAQMVANDAKATSDFQAAARAQEQANAAAVAKVEADYQAAQSQRDRIIAVMQHTGDGLRNQLSAYAHCNSGGLSQTDPGPIGTDDRAAVLGGLLGEATSLLVEGAGYGSHDAGQLGALQAIELAK